jgi:hypothetical protein
MGRAELTDEENRGGHLAAAFGYSADDLLSPGGGSKR